MSNTFDVVVIGAGPVGLFALYQAGMLGMKAAVIDILDKVGGQCIELYPSKPIYDIPAHPKILAKDLIENLKRQADAFMPQYYLGEKVVNIIYKSEKLWSIITDNQKTINAKVVLISSGNGAIIPNKPSLNNLDAFENRGTLIYKVDTIEKFTDKEVIVIGGGDSAFDWANLIAPIAKKVSIVHRRESFRCIPESLNIAKNYEKQGKLQFVIPYVLDSLIGNTEGLISAIQLRNVHTGNHQDLSADFVLMLLGLKMSHDSFANQLRYDKNHRIYVDSCTMQSNMEGIYAIGDSSTYYNKVKLILAGFSEASSALYHAYERVFDGKKLHFQYSTNRNDIIV